MLKTGNTTLMRTCIKKVDNIVTIKSKYPKSQEIYLHHFFPKFLKSCTLQSHFDLNVSKQTLNNPFIYVKIKKTKGVTCAT